MSSNRKGEANYRKYSMEIWTRKSICCRIRHRCVVSQPAQQRQFGSTAAFSTIAAYSQNWFRRDLCQVDKIEVVPINVFSIVNQSNRLHQQLWEMGGS